MLETPRGEGDEMPAGPARVETPAVECLEECGFPEPRGRRLALNADRVFGVKTKFWKWVAGAHSAPEFGRVKPCVVLKWG